MTSRDSQNAMGDITQVIEESVTAHKVVKLFGGQHYEESRSTTGQLVRRHSMKQAVAAAANVPIVQMIAALAMAVVLYLATSNHAAIKRRLAVFFHSLRRAHVECAAEAHRRRERLPAARFGCRRKCF